MRKTAYFLIFTVFIFSNCSSIKSVYIRDKYTENNGAMIKKVIVAVKVPENYPESALLISSIAADIIKLRTNYIVYEYKTFHNEKREDLCRKGIEGIFFFDIEQIEVHKNKVNLEIKSSLYNCSTGEYPWEVHAEKTTESDNADLKELTIEYKEKFKNSASLFAAPSFVIIQDIVESLPDPELTDDEVDLKIKLDAKK